MFSDFHCAYRTGNKDGRANRNFLETDVNRALILCLGTAICAVPFMAAAANAPKGQPTDLNGYWSNATLTREIRPANLGTQSVYTAEQARKLEAEVTQEVAEGNKPTDPISGVEGGKEDPKKLRPEFAAAGGDVGGYNRGWLDPGSSIMRVHGEPRTSFLTTPNGQPPARIASTAAQGGFPRGGGLGSFDNPENRSLGERCIMGFGRNAGPPMLPNGFYNNNYEFVQTPDSMAIVVEMVHDTRIIRMNGQHRTDGVRPWMGDSVGHWEGKTLVVETTNIPQSQAYNGSWKNLKVTERFTRDGADRVLYQYTIDDPTTWAKPWGGEYEFYKLQGIVYEYACHEGNYALPGMLAGARRQEKEAASGAGATKGGQ